MDKYKSFSSKEFHTIPETIFNLYKESNAAELKHEVIGGILSDTKLSWLAIGPYLQVFSTKTGEVKSVRCFGAVVKEPHVMVTCIEELKFSFRNVNLLVVGLKYGNHAGMVCIYNLSHAKVLRAIEIPQEVISLHVINPGNDATTFPRPLSALDGIISVGTTGGVVYLIDLCKERISECKKIANILDIRNETNPCQLRILTTSDVYDLERHKTFAEQEGTHVAILLNEKETRGKHFELRTPQGRNLILAAKEEVQVSTLHYAPQLCSLFIGYNFGALQIWNFLEMRLEYTSPVYEEKIPVSYIAIQEPIDDPRAFCYFWAVYSCKEAQYDNVYPLAALYSLSYEVKDYHEGYGYIYRGLQSCAVRFQANLRLADTSHCNSAIGASCIRLQSYNKSTNHSLNISTALSSAEDYTLCMMVWNVRCRDHKSHTYMSIFDLNQWYKEQMPDLPHQNNYKNYMSHLSLTNGNTRDFAILDAYIDPSSIDPFIGTQKLEEHYRPSSLAYMITTLTEIEVSWECSLGMQRGFFKELEDSGPLALMHPNELYTHARSLGLMPLFQDMPYEADLQVKCEILLSIALERKMLKWLCKCATSWGNGSHRSAGLSLELLLNWGWERTKQLKANADRYCSCLFDYSGHKLDNNHHALITACRVQFGNLKDLFTFVVKNCETFLIHPEITRQQLVWLQKNYAYFNVIGWMINLNLLPESKFTYPVVDIQGFYKQRREYLRSLGECDTSMNCLFIDQLTDIPSLKQEWLEDGSSEYPPTTMQTLLRCYFNDWFDIKTAHSLVAYCLLDLVVYCTENKNISVTMIKFPQIFDLSLSTTKAIQAFWQFDHGQLESAVAQLSSRVIHPQDLNVNQHQFIVSLLKLQGQYKLALKYMKSRNTKGAKDDVKHLIQLHVRNGMLYEALSIERRHSDNELLQVFFLECLQADVIMKLVNFNFTKNEELQLIEFMDKCKYARREDFKTVYFVRRGRFLDFYMRHDKEATRRDSLPSVVKTTLDSILPEVTKKVITTCMNLKGLTYNDSKSLSAYVCDARERAKFSSDFVKACVVNCRGQWQGDENLAAEDFPFMRPPFIKSKFETKGKSVIYTKQVDKLIPRMQPVTEDVDEIAPPSKRMRLDSPDLDHNLTTIETMHYSRNSTLLHNDNVTMTPHSILKTQSHRGDSSTPEDFDNLRRSLTPKLSARPSISTPSVRFKVSGGSSILKDSNTSILETLPKDSNTSTLESIPKDCSTSDYFTAETTQSSSIRENKKAVTAMENKRKRKLSNEVSSEEGMDAISVLRSTSFQYIGNINATNFLDSMRNSYVEEAVPQVNTQRDQSCVDGYNPPSARNSKLFVFTGNDPIHVTLSPKARLTYQTHANESSAPLNHSQNAKSSLESSQIIKETEITYEKKTVTRSMTKEIISWEREKDRDSGPEILVEKETRIVNQTKVADSWKEITMEEPNLSEQTSRVVDYCPDEDMDVVTSENSAIPQKTRTTKELVSHFEEVHTFKTDVEPAKSHVCLQQQNQSKNSPTVVEHLDMASSPPLDETDPKEGLVTPEIIYEMDTDSPLKSASTVSKSSASLQEENEETPTLGQYSDMSGICCLAETPADTRDNSSECLSEDGQAMTQMSRTVIDITSPTMNQSIFERTGFIDYFAESFDGDTHVLGNATSKRKIFLDIPGNTEQIQKRIHNDIKLREDVKKSSVDSTVVREPVAENLEEADLTSESLNLVVEANDVVEEKEKKNPTDDDSKCTTSFHKNQLLGTTIIEINDSPRINKSIFERSNFVDYFADSYVSPSDTINEVEIVTSEEQDNQQNEHSDDIKIDKEEEDRGNDNEDCKIYEELSNVNTTQYIMTNYDQEQDSQTMKASKSFRQSEAGMASELPEELFETMDQDDRSRNSDNSELNMAIVEVISINSSSSSDETRKTSSTRTSSQSNNSCSDAAEVAFIANSDTQDISDNSKLDSEPELGEIAFIADSTKSEISRGNTPKSEHTEHKEGAEEHSENSSMQVEVSTLPPNELGFIADSTTLKTQENLEETVTLTATSQTPPKEKEPIVPLPLPSISEEVSTTPKRKRRSLSRAESPALTIQLRPRRSSITSEPSTTPVKTAPKEKVKPVPKAVSRTRSMSTEGLSPSPTAKRVTRARSVDVSLPAIDEEKKTTTDAELMSARRLTRKQRQMMSDAPTMARLQLLDKSDFTGTADPEEVNLLQRSPPSSIASSSAAENAKLMQDEGTPKRVRRKSRQTPDKEQMDRTSRGGSIDSDRVLRSTHKELEVIKEEEAPKRGRRRSSVK